MEFTDAVGFKAYSNRGEMRWARVGGEPVLVSQDGAVIQWTSIKHETLEAPLGAPAFVASALTACTSGFMDDALCSPEDQMAATAWARTSDENALLGRLLDTGCYLTAGC